jgi:hypothetical protein
MISQCRSIVSIIAEPTTTCIVPFSIPASTSRRSAGRRAAVNLADPDPRPFEPLAEIRHVLANEVARRREDDDVTARLQNRVDGDAQHHFRLAGAGRRLEEKLEASARRGRSLIASIA